MMKVLFYADPARLYDSFCPSWTVLRDHLFRFCGKALLASGQVEVKAVVSEIARWQAKRGEPEPGLDLIEMSDADLRRTFPDCKSLSAMVLAFFHGKLDDGQMHVLADWFAVRLKGWSPDIVIAYPTQTLPLQRIFPKAFCLTMENGLFSRYPFRRTLRFDPIGFLHGFPRRFRDEIWNFPVDDGRRRAVREFRDGLCARVRDCCPVKPWWAELRRRFRHLVLCPVPSANPYGESSFDDQFLWLSDVMERVPQDVGVVITFHDSVGSQLNATLLEYFKAKHPNLIVYRFDDAISSQSLWVFPFVDAVLNCDSMTGLLGMLFGARVVALDRTYSGWFADGEGIDALPGVLAREPKDRTGMIYWLMTHFTVTEDRFDDATWYFSYFRDKLEAFRRDGVTFGLFGEVESFDVVAGFVLKSLDDFCAQVRQKLRSEGRLPMRAARSAGKFLRSAGDSLARLGLWKGCS